MRRGGLIPSTCQTNDEEHALALAYFVKLRAEHADADVVAQRMPIVLGYAADIVNLIGEANLYVIGHHVKFIKDFRDQPFGRSLPNLRGKTYVVDAIGFDGTRFHLRLQGLRCSAWLTDVAFVD
jgi:hypothetical protein